ncbi:hypothetical protein CRG98_020106 [Punica granatum]|uniref:Protein CHROMATIN REMODELING 35-like n=2 Tax=Punica granatum TaxID=22663 RepID=A0A2I0JT46_PUNGR|nr:hypothetical protein CRG98_020106 [Punica granatum]
MTKTRRRLPRPNAIAIAARNLRLKLPAIASPYCTMACLSRKRTSASQDVIDYSDPFAIDYMLYKLDCGRYGSATKDIEALIARKIQCLGPLLKMHSNTPKPGSESNLENDDLKATSHGETKNIIDLDEEGLVNDQKSAAQPVVILDSDEEDEKDLKPSYPFEEIFLPKCIEQNPAGEIGGEEHRRLPRKQGEKEIKQDKGEYVGVEDDEDEEPQDDALGDIWKEMNLALEISKDAAEDSSHDDCITEDDEEDDDDDEQCDHSFVLKDDIGYVCRVCGVIDKRIDTIVEIQYNKAKRSTRTYVSDTRSAKHRDPGDIFGFNLSANDLEVTDISAHPRHMKQMKPHQLEGFNFLVSNLVSEKPSGCILAHAPGSGKTFMILSFVQSFLAKYPEGRPLVVLPKGILATWKKEFQTWQVEDLPLLDLYTRKADKRPQQLEVLKQWDDQKSILFLGYKQFSTIVCDSDTSDISKLCQKILLERPTILILDEGHTPRNENTDVLQSLAKVRTNRKVVLSGTLYQNHVKEVFNILKLVCPKFFKMESSKEVFRRIMSRVDMQGRGGVRKPSMAGAEAAFYDLVEHTLQKDMDLDRKVCVIQDLREMTHKVLHYYKGDFLDELPGLVDFTVVLNLSGLQRQEVKKLKHVPRKFKVSAQGSAVYLHPALHLPDDASMKNDASVRSDAEMDELLEKINVRQGVKAKFFLSMLILCESAGEKLLVFSQYLTPLKFLERLVVKERAWCLGKEVFVISGETNADDREWAMERFNNSPDARVFFGSIKACGEGISLVGASRIIILDVHLNPSVTRQAIGRAFRPGQKKKVYAYRLVAADSPEEEDHATCFKKEKISKMWFEWNEHCGSREFEVDPVEVTECGDEFLASPMLREDVKALYKR